MRKLFATVVASALLTSSLYAAETPQQRYKRIMADVAAMDAQTAPVNNLLKGNAFTGHVAILKGKRVDDWVFHRDTAKSPDKAPTAKLWRWASVTKQIVAVIVMQEVQAGRIDLDHPIGRYLPSFKSVAAKHITVRQLLRHQSGLPNPDDVAPLPSGSGGFYASSYRGNRDPLTGFCAGKPKAKAGENWSYNNCDYMVAGALLEAVTGKPWSTLVDERIAKPFALKTLHAFPATEPTRTGLIGGKPEPDVDLARYGASGGLYGTAEDLIRFDYALMSGKLLDAASLKALWDGQPKLGFMALGQWVFDAPLKGCDTPVKVVERRGSIGGVQVRNFILPDLETAIVAFADQSENDFAFGEIWQGSGFSHDLISLAACS